MSIRESARAFTLCMAVVAGSSAACVSAPARAADTRQASDPFLAKLAGRWEYTGEVRGTPVRYAVEGRWVLGGAWLRIEMIDAATPPRYEAHVYLGHDDTAGDYVAHWLDGFGAGGARVVGTGRLENGRLVLAFPYADGEFRDTFTLAQDGASGSLLLEARAADGTWKTFASYRMKRL